MSIVESGNGRALKDAKPPLRKTGRSKATLHLPSRATPMLNLLSISLSEMNGKSCVANDVAPQLG